MNASKSLRRNNEMVSSSDSILLPSPPSNAVDPKLPASVHAKIPSHLPAVATLPTLDDTSLTATLDLLFEPSTDLHTLAVPTIRSITFSSYGELIDTLRDTLLSVQSAVYSDAVARAPLLGILGSHPRLGEKKVDSAQSRAEQARLQGGGEDQAARLAGLNAEYEEKFPGLRYVVFVNGRAREEIMENIRVRIDRGDMDAEEKEAIQAMCDIAKDRASRLLDATIS